jgi:hypothetical protein
MGSIALLIALGAVLLIPGRRARPEAVPELAHQSAGTVAEPVRPS